IVSSHHSRCLFFSFFYCSRDPRDLHSFPTRRSSDLPMTLPGWRVVALPLHEPLGCRGYPRCSRWRPYRAVWLSGRATRGPWPGRSEEHTSELQSRGHLVCRLLLEKKKKKVYEVGAID